MGETVIVPEFCPGGHKKNPGKVHISPLNLPFGLGQWFLHMEFECDKCDIKVYNQILSKPPTEVRDSGGHTLKIVT